jgi:hypothetical protein
VEKVTVEEVMMKKKKEVVTVAQDEILDIQVSKEGVEEKVNVQIILELEVEDEIEAKY